MKRVNAEFNRRRFLKASFELHSYKKLIKYPFVLRQVWHKSSQAEVRLLLNDDVVVIIYHLQTDISIKIT